MKQKMIIFGLLILVSLLIVGCGSSIQESSSSNTEEHAKISLSDLSDKVRFYEYNSDGVKINYFAVFGTDGEVRTAFDACDVCGGQMGYEQQGNDISCRKCERVFSIDGLGTKNKRYGCWPSYLPHEIKGGEVLIKVSDIKTGLKRFV